MTPLPAKNSFREASSRPSSIYGEDRAMIRPPPRANSLSRLNVDDSRLVISGGMTTVV